MDIKFWFPTIVTTFLAIVAAVIAYLKEDNPRIKWWILMIPIFGAVTGLVFSWSSNQDAIRALQKAHEIDSIYRSKFNEEIDSSKSIVSQLNTATITASTTLKNTSTVLNQQKIAGALLVKQILASKNIEKVMANSSRKFIDTINKATKLIDDNLTGGESFPTAEIINLGLGSYEIGIINKFTHNIPNVIVILENYSFSETCSNKTESGQTLYNYDCITKNTSKIDYTVYSPGVFHYYPDTQNIIIPDGNRHKLLFRFITPKYVFVEKLIYELKAPNKGFFYYQILKFQNKKLITIAYNDEKSKYIINWEKEFTRPLDVSMAKF